MRRHPISVTPVDEYILARIYNSLVSLSCLTGMSSNLLRGMLCSFTSNSLWVVKTKTLNVDLNETLQTLGKSHFPYIVFDFIKNGMMHSHVGAAWPSR